MKVLGIMILGSLWEIKYVDIRWNAAEQVEQKCSGEQAGWIDYQRFKLDSIGKGDGVPWDIEGPSNAVLLVNCGEKPSNFPTGTHG